MKIFFWVYLHFAQVFEKTSIKVFKNMQKLFNNYLPAMKTGATRRSIVAGLVVPVSFENALFQKLSADTGDCRSGSVQRAIGWHFKYCLILMTVS